MGYVEPALAVRPGIERVVRLCDAFFDFVGSGDFPGGCFFVNTSVDPASRRESIRRRLADEQRAWLGFIEQLVSEAIEAGALPDTLDPKVLAFELDAIMIGADANFVLLGDGLFLDEGRSAVSTASRHIGSVLSSALTWTARAAGKNGGGGRRQHAGRPSTGP